MRNFVGEDMMGGSWNLGAIGEGQLTLNSY